jgi:hypothetical protein
MIGTWPMAATLAGAFLLGSTLAAAAQNLPGPSPVSSGTFHSSPETPDKPRDWGDGLPPARNPSSNELSKQPSVGGRDRDGTDPTRPGLQGSQFKPGAPSA